MVTQKEKLLEKQAKIKARLAEIEIKEKAQRRKQETREKIIIGGAVLALEKTGQVITKDSIYKHIKEHASKRDQKLFTK